MPGLAVTKQTQRVLDLFEKGGRTHSGHGEAYLGIKYVAEQMGLAYSTARVYLTWLERKGYLRHTSWSTKGKHLYFLIPEQPRNDDGSLIPPPPV